MAPCFGRERLLYVGREELAPFVLWLLDKVRIDHSEVARVIEKPWAYGDWLEVYRRGGALDELNDEETSKAAIGAR